MAKKTKKEEPIVDKEVGKLKVNEPKGKETKGDVKKVKQKMKMKPEAIEETITKVDLTKPPKTEEDADQKQETTDMATDQPTEAVQEVVEEVSPEQDTVQDEDTPPVEEVTEEEKVEEVADKLEQAIEVAEQTGTELPEGIQKVVDFINETGGDLNDYVKLNQDYSEMDNQTVLEEYYRQTKPHLTAEERSFLMEDQFSYDEEEDTEKEIKRKKLALKEQVASAKSHLDGQKSKYYTEIKGGSKLTREQQEAIDFYNKAQERNKWEQGVTQRFENKTNQLFNDKFKGFEYNVGDKRFRVNVNDVDKTRELQSDINNFIGKFLDKDYNMVNEIDYHKGLYTAMNPDVIAHHFYEQGKADATKQSVTEAKNIDMKPRQELNENVTGGMKIRALDDEGPDFKFKIRNK